MQRYADRIHIIQYEALIGEPKAVITGLVEWLNVDPGRFNCDFVDAGSIGKHRTELTGAQLYTVLLV